MPATLNDSWVLATDPDFHKRVVVAIVRKAHAVKVAGASTTAAEKQQQQLAEAIMRSPEGYGLTFTRNIAARPEVPDVPTDAQITQWVDTVFPYIAAVTS